LKKKKYWKVVEGAHLGHEKIYLISCCYDTYGVWNNPFFVDELNSTIAERESIPQLFLVSTSLESTGRLLH
jgi:hypothetical protein